MLHPDALSMFDNGSLLRRRRRFKQEAAHGTKNSSGPRQRAQRQSSNTISPSNVVDARPNGTKASRSRSQMEKDSSADETDSLESPCKVILKEFLIVFQNRSFNFTNLVFEETRSWIFVCQS